MPINVFILEHASGINRNFYLTCIELNFKSCILNHFSSELYLSEDWTKVIFVFNIRVHRYQNIDQLIVILLISQGDYFLF